VSVEDDERSGRPSTSEMKENVGKIRELIHKDHHQTIHELADTAGISYGVRQVTLTENLNMRCIACPHVPENQFVTNNNIVIFPQPLYSLDIAP
jgi:hypothetical protein